ncbi:unnamed protein product [[Candida] boidinii]|uniref:Unnamed protein product n=1 Tax=Candida boidinii TaxID=5477 RepID=A0A9W6WDH7_CANBO|nr:hypothetical protein B5S30_g5148 [[Candida] boidinii]GME67082.1 unnamed protein product [[Candida] boidinii]GMF50414.1 unnamed protein product [[Candida] boidinii]GMG01402.1 unnamed protein product [[Candida] boidinii]
MSESKLESMNNTPKIPFISLISNNAIQYPLIKAYFVVYGGCCSNAFSLEKIVQSEKNASTLVTFSQFIFVSIVSYFLLCDFKNYSYKTLFIPPPRIPLKRYLFMTMMFSATSILTNFVFKFHISVPIHVIFRSLATSVTMLIGVLFYNKRYSWKQILSACLLTLGVCIVTLNSHRALENGNGDSLAVDDNDGSITTIDKRMMWAIGISILALSTTIASFMGLYSERTYAIYGRGHWKENLFYSHALGLPFFIFMLPSIVNEYNDIVSPHFFKWLSVNCITQLLCVTGVNMLVVSTSALTTGIILMIRKFFSLILSVVFFDFKLESWGYLGCLFVLVGALMYSTSASGSSISNKKDSKDSDKKIN